MNWLKNIWAAIKRLLPIAEEAAPEKYRGRIETGRKVLDAL